MLVRGVEFLIRNDNAKMKAKNSAKIVEVWDSPKMAAELLFEHFK